MCWGLAQQGKSEGFDSCDRPSSLTQTGFKSSNFSVCVTLKFDQWPRKIIGHLFYTTSSFLHHFKSIGELKLELQSGNAKFGYKSAIFAPCDLEIWQMTFENNRAPHLTYFKLCASFHSHWSIQTVVTVRKRPIWVKIGDFLPRVTCKLDGSPWKQ